MINSIATPPKLGEGAGMLQFTVRYFSVVVGKPSDNMAQFQVVSLNFRDEVLSAEYHKIRASQGTKVP
jgi:hypothetical protein